MIRFIKHSRWGLAEDPRGFQVTMSWQGRDLLGDVKDIRKDEWGNLRLVVRHFCGDPWPIDPVPSAVRVLE